ncbi:hypothetical protein HIM_07666 [Hirsutella minnesotensis 3608]|uniref:Nucleolar 27S pre-rRNA processing Urb2/Npa2 C-terminal domain-containing protein n=1 Tax=Hirsutella minnesotensis 3608 TaxID=1043627 RepID=A0A0F7ZTD1_9HYPO|nr:hypothetical protein HIM_07666 [Hirsutella minnesotensis 3608]
MTDLIKTVRGLDQSGPGENGQGLELLWSGLVASIDNPYHAAEESTLRWLLKSMNGPSAAAETMRRYPLTWTILERVFKRIPLFSLAKSLADRRFIAVLQQTLKDAAKPTRSPAASSPKRKKTPSIEYKLEELQTQPACLETAAAVFKTLNSLLARLDHAKSSKTSRDKIGAEHVRSLFCSTAAEAVGLVGPALTICGQGLTCSIGDIQDAEFWIDTISRIWDLHLQGSDDASQVAIHLFQPAATILARLGSFPSGHKVDVPDVIKSRWNDDVEKLMHRNFIAPGRAAFVQSRTLEAFAQALEVSKAIVHLSAPALYYLCCCDLSQSSDGELRKDNVEWLKQMFKSIELELRERQDRGTLMKTILDLAIQRSTSVDVHDLRRVCREYALQDAATDWGLIAKVVTCDPDVLQLSDDGIALREDICRCIMKQEAADHDKDSIARLIGGIMDGFRTRRDIAGFLRLWLEQLLKAERRETDQRSPWLNVGQADGPTKSLTSLIETDLSPSQLLDVITWAATKKPKKYPQSICIFASTIARAVRREPFVDAVGKHLFDLVEPISGSEQVSALKWRVVSATLSWAAPSEKAEIWASVKSRISKILKSSPVTSSETYEAFKCSLSAWDSLSLDSKHKDKAASTVQRFIERFDSEMADESGLRLNGLLFTEPDLHTDLQQDSVYQQYLAWYLCGSSRFNKLYFGRKGGSAPMLSKALALREDTELQSLWCAFLRNEVNLSEPQIANESIDRLIAMLDETHGGKWPNGQDAVIYIRLLASLPTEAFSRDQRERLMSVLIRHQRPFANSTTGISVRTCRFILGLMTKMMGRPTFYDGMVFADLIDLAKVTSSACISDDAEGSSEILLELTERFSLMASSTVKQMAGNMDDRSVNYFRDASNFVKACPKESDQTSDSCTARQPLLMTLLKALTAELALAPNWQNQAEIGTLGSDAKKALSKSVADTIHKLVAEKKRLASPDAAITLSLFAAVDAASVVNDIAYQARFEPSTVKKLEKLATDKLAGDLRGWKLRIFLRNQLSVTTDITQYDRFDELEELPRRLRRPLLRELVLAITQYMRVHDRRQYLKKLLDSYLDNSATMGQIWAIQTVVEQLLDPSDVGDQEGDFTLAAAHNQLILALSRKQSHSVQICQILQTLLERRPQAMKQWNIELTLSTVCEFSSGRLDDTPDMRKTTGASYPALCKLVEAVIKKHRVRLEGHYHLLLSALQALLRNLVVSQVPAAQGQERCQESMAQAYGRLITLICEPTAGAVSRSQLHGALDSATDAAKRSAGRHMYLVLMQYVKLQLEANVPRVVREALEPAVNSIFDITSPETRKILNDAMDSSGRAILREMYKRYVKFGKWSGV